MLLEARAGRRNASLAMRLNGAGLPRHPTKLRQVNRRFAAFAITVPLQVSAFILVSCSPSGQSSPECPVSW
jgi:hypothetical protein